MTKFKGHDYTELADAWGIEHPEAFDDDRVLLDEIREYIWDAFDDRTQELDLDVMRDMINFLEVLIVEAERICYKAPVFRSLLEIDDHFTFVQFFDLLLPEMWT